MKLSVIIPTYNRSEYLIKTIKKLIFQSYEEFEIIVVDDCSTDKTKEVVNKFIKKYSKNNIRYIVNKKNIGTMLSEYNGLKYANSEYITFLADDDEIYDKDFFKIAMQYNEDIISAKYNTILNGILIKNNFKSQKQILTSNEALNIFSQFVLGGNTIFKKDIIMQAFETKVYHDFSIIFFAIINANSIRFINRSVFNWYLNLKRDSFSSTLLVSPYELLKWDLKFLDEIIPILKNKNLYKKYKWFINTKVFQIFENVSFNYYLSNKEKYFNNILNEINNEVYIYGYGQIGNLLKEFLIKNNIKVLGFIDDYRDNCLKINEIDKSKQIIIATYKPTLIHKIYKNLIKANIPYENIKELV